MTDTLRQERKLSQEVLRGFACMARSHLAMIENGSKQLNFETIWRIANGLQMAPSEPVQLIEQDAQRHRQEGRQPRGF